jgi:MFS family permease
VPSSTVDLDLNSIDLATLSHRRPPFRVIQLSQCADYGTPEVQESVLSPTVVQTDIPFRLDRLPLSRFHLLVVVGLGVTWILDGLEVTIVGSLGPALQSAQTLNLSSANLGAVASFYVVGAVTGALGFGWITDRFGRRLVFYVTLIVYLTGVLLSAMAWDFWSFALFRMVTGLGIGGEYAAVNSAIDELIPAKYRGRIDLVVNGSFWLGAAAGALAAPVLLDQNLLPVNVGWRLGFGIGGVLGFSILMLRRFVPESPRWLVTHCHSEEAEETVKRIEADVVKSTGRNLPPTHGSLKVHPRKVFGLGLILSAMLGRYRQRSILALAHGSAVLSVQFGLLYVRLDHRQFLSCPQRAGRPLL